MSQAFDLHGLTFTVWWFIRNEWSAQAKGAAEKSIAGVQRVASGPSPGPRRYQLQKQWPKSYNPLCLSLRQCENLMLVTIESPVIGSPGLIGAPAVKNFANYSLSHYLRSSRIHRPTLENSFYLLHLSISWNLIRQSTICYSFVRSVYSD